MDRSEGISYPPIRRRMMYESYERVNLQRKTPHQVLWDAAFAVREDCQITADPTGRETDREGKSGR